MFCTFTLVLSVICVQCTMTLFSVVPSVPVCSSGIFWMLLGWLQLPLFFYVPHVLYFCCSVFMFWNLLSASWSGFSFLKLQHLLTYFFFFQCHILWCAVYCQGLFCQFAICDSIIWLPCLHDLFLLILVHTCTIVHCVILFLFPCMCYSVVKHALCCVSLYAVLLPVLGMLI
jgi:hypothetical protein